MEHAQVIDPGFSVADAEHPVIRNIETGLLVSFLDWREQQIEVLFEDAVSFRWDQLDWNFIEGERFDSIHTIHESKWIEEHIDQNSISFADGYHHYRLNFNAAGTLQVIARNIEKRAEQDGGGNSAALRSSP